ncbi:MAG: ATP-binding protein [Clostridia bacterium]|nr:ATP-binding protein [Clostridia bacterium]
MLKRKIYDKLVEWKKESEGKTALLIEGARRIGKSTVAEEFAKNEYKSYILIDFSLATQSVKDLFDNMTDLNFFFLQLQLLFHVDLFERNSLIIFDEVQFFPKARQPIKHLVKDRRYDYLETGSLISIKKNVKDILIPSEEQRISMYPMDYEEFLWATGDNTTIPLIRQCFESRKPVGEQLNRRLMRDFRLYMLVGGMPQAVNEYIETNNFRKVDLVKRTILSLYEEDFRKVDPSGRASRLFDAIPAQLAKNASRYQTTSVLKKSKTDKIAEIISEMESSKTVLISYHANDPNVGLSATEDLSAFKMYVSDTGLFVTLMFKDRDFTENVIYEKLLNDKLSANLGYLFENIVAQTLASAGNKLFYYTFFNESSRHNYEIDFILSRQNKICPVEVKSSGYKAHVSLDRFFEKYSSRILRKYLVYPKDLAKDTDTLCVPVYMAQFL